MGNWLHFKVILPISESAQTLWEDNQSMGGVDLADYRIQIRSKKYYLKLIFHMLNMIMVNSWLLYKRCARSLHKQKIRIFLLQHSSWELRLCSWKLVNPALQKGNDYQVNRHQVRKGNTLLLMEFLKKLPYRYDGVGHWPSVIQVRRICRFTGCKGRTNVTCLKCNVHLCLNSHWNHFYDYHSR